MDIIPVIDLAQGRVVRARHGDRAGYRPIESALCGSSDPTVVGPMLCTHCASGRLYVADLDALQGGASQHVALQALLEALPPEIELWVDGGHATARDAAWSRSQFTPVLRHRLVDVHGSESFRTIDAAAEALATPRAVLSLDRRHGKPLDPVGLWHEPTLWPSRIVVMTLERVGADAGPDLATFERVRAQAPHALLIGAGGIRDVADLAAAAAASADAWLVASALHDLRIPRCLPRFPASPVEPVTPQSGNDPDCSD